MSGKVGCTSRLKINNDNVLNVISFVTDNMQKERKNVVFGICLLFLISSWHINSLLVKYFLSPFTKN